jgi:hypothetical protein
LRAKREEKGQEKIELKTKDINDLIAEDRARLQLNRNVDKYHGKTMMIKLNPADLDWRNQRARVQAKKSSGRRHPG